ncbi:MAG: phosphoserine phosphatase RsbU/P [Gaiellaceae bacterium]|jgi:PAS domain S-box-containing protein|nr:phosphoserine phosphatase RsbU/P [Gaiellaceae bacterium]
MPGAAETLVQIGLLGEALDGGPVGIFLADETMKYIAVNRYACEMLGYTREELLGKQVTDVAPAPTSAASYRQMIVERGQTGTTELVRKDGGTLEINYRAAETRAAGLLLYVSVVWPVEKT